ncbi:diguanylate cyclase domain-containing protein [Methylobacter sp. S3L5C]|uniref:diguanylate cyclase domain-containing protein n=1 Tax=Methylobacter sp. S3L5C TaxID=2839024 RepID=UPI001FAE4742|nr:diguanylate cyclase [Methylobacter sp. S3L5C]UOA06973.1 diguanylate cyclase [Methylobacter sp. S3L5C]
MRDIQQGPIILIVDDIPDNIKILAEALRSDYRIKVANNGHDALDLAERVQPDLILLDIMMPDMDGFETCRRLKENAKTRKIAVIFVTAMSGETDAERGLNLGAVDYIIKPFVIPVAKARIRNHLLIKQQADLLDSRALLDALTLIPNRRCFDETFAAAWQQASQDKTPLSLAIIEVDDFKHYNDRYGHGIGDSCLKKLATVLTNSQNQPGDLSARLDGNAFALILPNTDSTAARQITEGLRECIQNMGMAHAESKAGAVVTISVGVATQMAMPTYSSSQELYEAANNALHTATANGGNQVA